MKLYVLPNGDAVRPSVVQCVKVCDAANVELTTGAVSFPPRCVVRANPFGDVVINATTMAEAEAMRDKIIAELNDALNSEEKDDE